MTREGKGVSMLVARHDDDDDLIVCKQMTGVKLFLLHRWAENVKTEKIKADRFI